MYNKSNIFTSETKGRFRMGITKARIRIGGADYLLTTDGDVNYLRYVADEVDISMTTLMKENHRLSMTQAAVLCALQFADDKHKEEEKTLTIRKEIQDYMEDASKAKTDAEVSKREVDRLNKEIRSLKTELARYKHE